jgi:hypothetical protein
MMTTTDTSAEARHWIGMAPDWAGSTATEGEPELREFLRDGATHMAALLAERDEAIQRGNDWCDQARKLRGERDRLREALRLTAMLFEQIMVAIDADPAETFLSVKIQPNGAEVKRITVAECLAKARAALGIEEPAHE